MLCVQPNLPKSSYERLTQIFFERFNAAALAIYERPLLQLFSINALSGVVIDIGPDSTEIGPVLDSDVYRYGLRVVPVGAKQCEWYLVNVLKANAALMSQIKTQISLSERDLDSALFKIVRVAEKEGLIHISESGGVSVITQTPIEDEGALSNIAAVLVAGKEKAVIEAVGNKKKTAAQEKRAAATAAEKERQALDLVDLEVSLPISPDSLSTSDAVGTEERIVTVTLGKERHRLCDPLFNPTLLNQFRPLDQRLPEGSIGIDGAVRLAVSAVDHPQRAQLWDGIFLAGDTLKVKSASPVRSSQVHAMNMRADLETALSFRLSPFATRDAETQWPGQPVSLNILKIPAYFAEFQERGDVLAAFLGACIGAKV